MNIVSNLDNTNKNNLIDNKICIVCLDNENDNNKLIEYNHCGLYYIHNSCLNSWKYPECLICRKKINLIQEEHINQNIDITPIIEEEQYIINSHNVYNIGFYKTILFVYAVGIGTILIWLNF